MVRCHLGQPTEAEQSTEGLERCRGGGGCGGRVYRVSEERGDHAEQGGRLGRGACARARHRTQARRVEGSVHAARERMRVGRLPRHVLHGSLKHRSREPGRGGREWCACGEERVSRGGKQRTDYCTEPRGMIVRGRLHSRAHCPDQRACNGRRRLEPRSCIHIHRRIARATSSALTAAHGAVRRAARRQRSTQLLKRGIREQMMVGGRCGWLSMQLLERTQGRRARRVRLEGSAKALGGEGAQARRRIR